MPRALWPRPPPSTAASPPGGPRPADRGAGGPQGSHRPGRPPHHLRVVLLAERPHGLGHRGPPPGSGGSGDRGPRRGDEFAFGYGSADPWWGPVRNPWDLETSAGGSSAGSAAAVAGARPRWGSAPTPGARCGSRRPLRPGGPQGHPRPHPPHRRLPPGPVAGHRRPHHAECDRRRPGVPGPGRRRSRRPLVVARGGRGPAGSRRCERPSLRRAPPLGRPPVSERSATGSASPWRPWAGPAPRWSSCTPPTWTPPACWRNRSTPRWRWCTGPGWSPPGALRARRPPPAGTGPGHGPGRPRRPPGLAGPGAPRPRRPAHPLRRRAPAHHRRRAQGDRP